MFLKIKDIFLTVIDNSIISRYYSSCITGFGSVLNLDGEVEMDALIMNGSNLNAGAVTVVKDIAHPIR